MAANIGYNINNQYKFPFYLSFVRQFQTLLVTTTGMPLQATRLESRRKTCYILMWSQRTLTLLCLPWPPAVVLCKVGPTW